MNLRAFPGAQENTKRPNAVLHSLETASCWVWWDMGLKVLVLFAVIAPPVFCL